MGLVESWVRRPSPRVSTSLDLTMGLRPIREHVIMHRDACILSSLKERDTLDIFMSLGFPIKGPLWKTLTRLSHFAHFSHEGYSREIERVFFKNNSSWLD